MKKIILEAKKMITAKAIISAASLGLLLPFFKLIYWVFDTSYLSGFGVSPDVYSRPVFSSGFVSVWLIVKSLVPIFYGWISFSIILFFALMSMNLSVLERPQTVASSPEILEDDSFLEWLKKAFPVAYSKSISWPLSLVVIGTLVILFIINTLTMSSRKASSLSDEQMKQYNDTGQCHDKFNSDNIGCFNIPVINGRGLFVIANTQTHLLYLSREASDASKPNASKGKFTTKLHIHEKKSDDQYSITREYIPVKAKVED
jgi:hypothetical protein